MALLTQQPFEMNLQHRNQTLLRQLRAVYDERINMLLQQKREIIQAVQLTMEQHKLHSAHYVLSKLHESRLSMHDQVQMTFTILLPQQQTGLFGTG